VGQSNTAQQVRAYKNGAIAFEDLLAYCRNVHWPEWGDDVENKPWEEKWGFGWHEKPSGAFEDAITFGGLTGDEVNQIRQACIPFKRVKVPWAMYEASAEEIDDYIADRIGEGSQGYVDGAGARSD
jgi:hypothetical protein